MQPLPATDSHSRLLWPCASIIEGDRARKDYGDLAGLADSIRSNGLIHPIVINTKGRLIAGGRRLRACRDILKLVDIPVTYFEFADEATLRILEREENVRRKPMVWTEEMVAVLAVHRHHELTAALESKRWTQRATGELLGVSEASVSYALQLGDLVERGDKDILSCKNAREALDLLIKRRCEESNKVVAKLTIPAMSHAAAQKLLHEEGLADTADIFSAPTGASSGGVGGLADDGEMPSFTTPDKTTIPLSRMLLKGDCLSVLEQLGPGCVDHIITDPPYAIDMDMLEQSNPHGGMKDVDLVRKEHDVYENEALFKVMIPAFYSALRDNGFLIMWADQMKWQLLYDLCIRAGFKVQRWPLIWYKTHRCMNQAASYNFTKNIEIAIVCRKGNATLLTPQPSSVWSGSNEGVVAALGHPFAKPFELWQWLFSATCQRGQTVLDPFAGRGSSTIAAIRYGVSPVAIEVNDAHHDALVVNVANEYQKTLKNVEFK